MEKNTKITIIISIVVILAIAALLYFAFREKTEAPTENNKADTSQASVLNTINKNNESKMKIEILKEGTGEESKAGDKLAVNYTGTLENGVKFDSSLNPGRTPFVFTVGAGDVIQGWDQGMIGMKVGEQRKLTIPPELGYGAYGAGNGLIPPNSTLIFVVDLLKIN
jgi:FKBP-type peptidyl-prolyl cis-trans isomerase